MSWFFGIAGHFSEEDRTKLKSIALPHLCQFEKPQLLIISGGIPDTLKFGYQNLDKTAGWILTGAPFISKKEGGNNSYSFLTDKNLNQIFSTGEPDLKNLNGHFAGVKFDNQSILCFTDDLGIRDIYISTTKDYLIFSTRLDLIARFKGGLEINFDELSTRWLLQNQLSSGSILTDTIRLTAKARISIKLFENRQPLMVYSEQNWLPNLQTNSSQELLLEKLTSMSTFPIINDKFMKLGLSGGMDSRFLVSLLISSDIKSWDAVTFGNPEHPDVKVASDIAAALGINHSIFYDKDYDFKQIIDPLKAFISQSLLTAPASEYSYKKNMQAISRPGEVFIDGGFAEILRRGLFNNILYFGKKALLNKDSDKLLRLLSYQHADIFNHEITLLMIKSAKNHIIHLIESMPEINEFGIENWLDLLAIRTKLVNYCGIEQARCDNFLLTLNPFSQAEIFNLVLNLNLRERHSARMVKQFIKKNTPELTKFPLVKGSTTTSFSLSQLVSKAEVKFKGLIKRNYNDTTTHDYLHTNKKFILEILNSKEVQQYQYYDPKKINNIVNSYFAGNNFYEKQTDWWLTFELFRREMG